MSDSQCFCTILRETTRRLTAIYDETLVDVGVNLAQFNLLQRLERSGPLGITELAGITDLNRTTISRNVKVIERKGLVALEAGEDRRESVVLLTKSGREILTRGLPLWEKAQSIVEAKLGRAGADKLRNTLRTL
ncbi:MarR family winged helix-turn-helix transcriptional regulator [Bradyrhizobium sp. 170]|uniref:MarR family winged helix-turn-helix transcriptional regulator n=1 Tax=Bradyrhizobium sp. 170 TaxID=2782641 RepID=UPI001FFE2F23|nr:MarR family winged helix-turn-helix transcriptional regulator [Bradyrhizobium sp. 170]UPK06472.1 winged helix-turn-helix transcriptional regulator [Bradyrhizobium sp. 170]